MDEIPTYVIGDDGVPISANESELRGELVRKAKELGVPHRDLEHNDFGLVDLGGLHDRILRKEAAIREAEAAERSSRMWWFSLGSLIVSVLSAAAAWYAVVANVN